MVSKVLEPFFRCESIRYREYFSLGGSKIFFWPWAWVLSGVMACVGIHRCPDPWCWGTFSAIVLLAGLYELRGWSITRSLPWFFLLVASLGFLFSDMDPGMVLGCILLVVFLHTLTVDYRWAGFTPGLAIVLAIGLVGFGLFLLFGNSSTRELVLWVDLVLLVSFQEWRECNVETNLGGYWRAAALVVFPALALLIWYSIERGGGWVAFAVALVLMVGGRWEPWLRLRRAEETIMKQLDDILDGFRQRPNLIAHSLGSYLAGNLFKTYFNSWDRVIFVGGVISEVYDWNVLSLGGPNTRIREVRNEHGGWDLVVRSIRFSGEWGRQQGLGEAGLQGFAASPAHPVHSVEDVRAACPHCLPGPASVFIHNYRFLRYRHSSYFLRQHARELWLPFFLNLVPAVYANFIETCVCGAEFLKRGDTLRFRDVEQIFQTQQWNFDPASGRNWTLAQYVEEALRSQITSLVLLPPLTWRDTLNRVQQLVPGLLCMTIEEALREQEISPPAQVQEIVFRLDPLNAISHAARGAFFRMPLQ